MRDTYFRCISSHKNLQLGQIGHARILLFHSAPVIFVSAVVTTVVTVLKRYENVMLDNCSRSKSHFIRYCCVLLKTVTRRFVYTIGFFHNGGMLTSSSLDQRSAKFGSADTRSEQLIRVVLFIKNWTP